MYPPLQYFAVGTAAWFEAIARTDINSGIVSRARMGVKDPGLASLMRWVRAPPTDRLPVCERGTQYAGSAAP
jgi:hypothetical protein